MADDEQPAISLEDPSSVFVLWPQVKLSHVTSAGGGRGVITTEDVPAGTILLREAPFFAVNPDAAAAEGETLHSQIAREIVEAGAGRMPELSALHPITLEPPHLTAEQKSFASEKHSDAVNKLLTAEKAKADGYTFDEVLRVVLAVQFNAFSSGMYFALAMINHACSPNCSKFAPRKQAKAGAWKTGGDGAAAGGGGGEGPAVNALPKVPSAGSAAASSSSTSSSANARLGSEIVACRDIKAGTEITIHYSTTVERAHHTRDRTFREQHYMPLDPSPFPDEIDGTLTKEQMKLATELDTALDEFDTGAYYNGTKGLSLAAATARFQKAVGFRDSAVRGLPPKHLVATRTHATVVREVHLTLAASSNAGGGVYTAEAGSTAIVGLQSASTLRARFPDYLSANDHACATAAGDEATLLAFLMSNDPELLYSSFPETLPSFSKASRAEYAARKVHKKLKKLYE